MDESTDHESEASVKRFAFSNLLLIVISVLLTVLIAIASFAWSEVRNHDDRIKRIEENHISTKTIQDLFKTDFHDFRQSIDIKMDRQMNQFKSELRTMESRLEERISNLDDRIMNLYER